MQLQRVLRNEKGIAMVLAVSMIALLSLFGVWMLVESQTTFRVTTAMERRQSAFNLAEAALQLNYRCLYDNSLSPSYANLTDNTPVEVTPSGLTYMNPEQGLGEGYMTPTLQYLTYRTTPPSGWMINWQGASSFHSLYFRAMGKGTIPLPSGKANARNILSALLQRVTR